MAKDTYEVPKGVQQAAKKGLELHQEHGRGGTDVGLKMAKKLARGGSQTCATLLNTSPGTP